MNPSLISIYITNHNYGKYIRQSIESVLNQTYQEFELLIIDDGSTDNSKDVISNYTGHEKVQIKYQKRTGLNACNNIALKNAKGRYMIRLDADDYFMTDAIEKMVHVLDDNQGCALVFPDYHLVDSDGMIIRTVLRHNFNDNVTLFDLPAHGACTMIRKSVLDIMSGYDEEFDRQDGYDLWLKVIHKYQIKNINTPLFYYRQHNSNLTKNNTELLRTRAKIKAKHIKSIDYKSLDILTIIPVRGSLIDPSSKPLEKIGDKCLLDWSIDSVLNSEFATNIIISTSDTDVQNHLNKTFKNKIRILTRNPELARLNVGIEDTIEEAISYHVSKRPIPDAIIILYIDYPFKQPWQINEVVHTMQIFNVDIVDGIRLDDRFYYQHDGGGLKPFVKGGGLHLERDQLYRRVGGIQLINTDFFLKHKKMIAGKIGHIHFDQLTGFQIRSELDFKLAGFMAQEICKEIK